MTKIVFKKRVIGGQNEVRCKCGEVTEERISNSRTELPYCGSCGKCVLDLQQNYCMWCGNKFE